LLGTTSAIQASIAASLERARAEEFLQLASFLGV
jgi:hypothetical protein